MNLRRAAVLATVAALSAGAAVGCSSSTDGSNGSAGTTTTLSPRDAFVAQGNAICRGMQDRGNALTTGVEDMNDTKALANLMRQMQDVVGDTTAKLRALTPPPGQEAQVAAAIDALDQAGKATGALADASAADDQYKVSQAVAAQSDAQEKADQAMTSIGLTACAFADVTDSTGTSGENGTGPTEVPRTTAGPVPATAQP